MRTMRTIEERRKIIIEIADRITNLIESLKKYEIDTVNRDNFIGYLDYKLGYFIKVIQATEKYYDDYLENRFEITGIPNKEINKKGGEKIKNEFKK